MPKRKKPGEALHLKLLDEVWVLHWKLRAARQDVERQRQTLSNAPLGLRYTATRTVSRMEEDVRLLAAEVDRRTGEVMRMGKELSRLPSRRKA